MSRFKQMVHFVGGKAQTHKNIK